MTNLKNNWYGLGRVAKEIATSQNGDNFVARTTIAVQRNFKNKDGGYDADFIPVVAFGTQAKFLNEHFTKGDAIIVSGSIRTGSYTNKDGQKVYTTDVFADQIDFVPGSPKKTDNGEQKSEKNTNVDPDEDFMTISDEEAGGLPW